MKAFWMTEITFLPLQMFLMIIHYMTRVAAAGVLVVLLFGLKPVKKKYRYALVGGIAAVFAVFSAFMMKGAVFSDSDYFCILLNFVTVPFFFDRKVKTVLRALVGAMVYEVIGLVKILVLMLSGFTSDEIYRYSTLFLPEFFANILCSAVVFGIAVYLAGKKKQSTLAGKINITLYLLILTTFTVFIITLIILGVEYTKNVRQFVLIFMNIPLFAVTVGYALAKFINTKNSEQKYKELLDLQISHYETMERKNEELKLFRHDFPKMMRPLLLDIREGKTEEAEQLLQEFDVTVANLRPMYHTGNVALDTVLECAEQTAQKDNIHIVLGAGSVFPEQGIATRDIYTIFPNALDNAMEACRLLGGAAEIRMESRIKAGAVYVKITNPCRSEALSTNEPLKTTKAKKDAHGYGTKSIKKAAAKYGEDNVTFSVENGMFTLAMKLERAADSNG